MGRQTGSPPSSAAAAVVVQVEQCSIIGFQEAAVGFGWRFETKTSAWNSFPEQQEAGTRVATHPDRRVVAATPRCTLVLVPSWCLSRRRIRRPLRRAVGPLVRR